MSVVHSEHSTRIVGRTETIADRAIFGHDIAVFAGIAPTEKVHKMQVFDWQRASSNISNETIKSLNTEKFYNSQK